MDWLRLEDLDIAGRVVLTRVDLNVPLADGRVSDTTRIDRAVATIDAILKMGGKPVLLSHFGRPKGRRVDELSLKVVLPALEAALGRTVRFAGDCIGPEAKDAVAALGEGEVLLLENVRFHPGEEANDAGFAGEIAALGDVYCNDAFSAAHRAHATTEGIAHLLPACAGRQMEAELTALERALTDPRRPVGAIVGGSKVSSKISLLHRMVDAVDFLVIGGAMANTFIAAEGHAIGKSFAERGMLDTARQIAERAGRSGCELILPVDVVVAGALAEGSDHRIVLAESVPDDMMILDAGPRTVEAIKAKIAEARTIIWNGPLGAFEIPPFDAATRDVARYVAARSRSGEVLSVAGGGDTVAALNAAGAADGFSYVSTAGGAFLEWLEGRELPGIAALGRDMPKPQTSTRSGEQS